MRFSGKASMYLCLIVMGGGVAITARKWPVRTGLFPIIVGISVVFMAATELFFTLFGRKEDEDVARGPAVDFSFSAGVDEALATRRTLVTFAWTVGFYLMIVFFGFTLATLFFLFLYLKFQSKEGWRISLIVTASTWIFYYGLFIWLLDTEYPEALLMKWLRTGRIM